MEPFLAEKYTGLKMSTRGLLGRISMGFNVEAHHRYACGEMERNLNEKAARFYAGDIRAVDEFLQMYCLDGCRPDTGNKS